MYWRDFGRYVGHESEALMNGVSSFVRGSLAPFNM